MHDPCWGAGLDVGSRGFLPALIHCLALRIEEGRSRPSLVISNFSHRFQPWIKPQTAKSASSQGGALATTEGVFTSQLNRTEDMNMESLHD
jgi:hypothetical protein